MGKERRKMGKIDFDLSKIKKVKIDEVRVNSWNPKKADTPEFEKVKKGIKLKGLRGAIIVRENPNDISTYEIIDGHQRYTASKELGFKELYIYNEGNISDKEAKELTIWYQQQVPFDRIDEAYLFNELKIEFNDLLELPYTEAEEIEMQELANFDFSQYDPNAYTEPTDEDGVKTLKLVLNEEAYNVIMQAIKKAQNEADNISEARAIELICADYLGGYDGTRNS
jgi:hypothetical protein